MSDDIKAKLEARLKVLQEDFNKLGEEQKTLNEQLKKIQQRMSQIQAEQIGINGRAAEVQELLDTPTKEKKK